MSPQTRILVTHNVAYLPQMDHIIVLRNGTISECGTYDELLKSGREFADFLATYVKDNEEGSYGTFSPVNLCSSAENIFWERNLCPSFRPYSDSHTARAIFFLQMKMAIDQECVSDMFAAHDSKVQDQGSHPADVSVSPEAAIKKDEVKPHKLIEKEAMQTGNVKSRPS